jgi:predicted Zn-dependent peptidase
MALDRTQAPPVVIPPFRHNREPERIEIIQEQNRSFFFFAGKTDPYIRLQFCYPFSPDGYSHPLVPGLTTDLLKEGTKNRSMQELADAFDYYGTELNAHPYLDFTCFSVSFLKKHLSPLMEILADVFLNPVFEESSIQRLLMYEKQKFLTSLNKTSYLSKREITRLFFQGTGLDRILEQSDFDTLHREQLVDFFNRHFLSGPHVIIITGGNDTDADAVIQYFKNVWKNKAEVKNESIKIHPKKGRFSVVKSSALQTSLRLMKEIPGVNHPDYPYLYMLNQWLGGYFGSRLMKNIREEKGYTYGIGSSINRKRNITYLTIHTEVGSEVTKPALEEILNEISLLSEDTYPKEDLHNLAAYMAGRFLERNNGLFENADSFMRDYLLNISKENRKSLYDIFFTTDLDRLKSVARQWLNPEEFTIVLAGDEKYVR